MKDLEWPAGTVFTFRPGVNQWNDYRGLVSDAFPGFDPVGAEAVVHDVLEHFPGDPPTPEAEWQAQGAMVLVRAEGGWFGDPKAPGADGGRALWDFWQRVDGAMELLFKTTLYHWEKTPPAPEIHLGERFGGLNQAAQEWIKRTVDRAKIYCAPEAVRWYESRKAGLPGGLWSAGLRASAFLSAQLLEATGWMVTGYLRAKARFASNLDLVREQYRAATAALENRQLAECDEIKVTVHEGPRLEVSCACHTGDMCPKENGQ